MSDREKAKHLIDQIPEYKIELVLAYLQGVFDGVSETPNKETIAAFKEIEEGGGHLKAAGICFPDQLKICL